MAAWDARIAHGQPNPGDAPSSADAGGRRYSRSKLCNVLFTFELARQLSGGRRVEVAAFNPGLMLDTGLVSGVAGRAIGRLVWAVTPLLRCTPLGRFIRSAPASGADLAYVATAALPPAPSLPRYFDGLKPAAASALARSGAGAQAAAELWRH